MAPVLNRVLRLDSVPLNQTFFTPEGYLIDRPIVTSTGIFEYHNEDGSVRRELRLPEEVFAPKSLASYKGRPVIVTHDAGLITKNNVSENTIGTILSEGYRSGNDVKCEVVIHDTDEMKRCGYKELSLGYNLDLDETPGEWNGMHYDAIQRNITINHLALVKEARAGDQARLNIDSRDKHTPKGVKVMAKNKKTSRADSVLSPEEFNQAIEEYKARRAERMKAKKDSEEEKQIPLVNVQWQNQKDEPKNAPAGCVAEDEEEVPVEKEPVKPAEAPAAPAAKAPKVDPENDDKKVIAQMDEDMSKLFDIIDTLLAERDFGKAAGPEGANAQGGANGDGCMKKDEVGDVTPIDTIERTKHDEDDEEKTPFGCNGDEDEEETVMDGCKFPEYESDEDEEDMTEEDDPEMVEDEEDEVVPAKCGAKPQAMNADSIDKVVRQRVKIGIYGQKLNMDGLEDMPIKAAKKSIIKAVRPKIRLDGKSDAYINAIFDMACSEIDKSTFNSTDVQRMQMFNGKKKRMDSRGSGDSANNARQRMIERQNKKED